jgi:hypothetical protein
MIMTLGVPRNHGCRISDEWSLAGMRAIVLENELLRVVVLADKGSDIVEFRYKPLDLDFLFFAPGGIRNPQRVAPPSASTAPFLDYYSGGWNEILPNGGPHVEYRGAGYGQHGEVSLIPWDYAILEDAPEGVAVRMWARPLRTPLFIEKTLSMKPGRAALFIQERLKNESSTTLDVMWGHHIAFGLPFLEEGAVIDTPARAFEVHAAMPGFEPRRFQPEAQGDWPAIPGAHGARVDASTIPARGEIRTQELAYLSQLPDGWYAITNPARQVGFGVRFDPRLFRYLWYWQQLGGAGQDYPWWGGAHVAALEPWTSYPSSGLGEAIARGTALQLQPGQEIHTSLTALAYAGFKRVTSIGEDGQVQGNPS